MPYNALAMSESHNPNPGRFQTEADAVSLPMPPHHFSSSSSSEQNHLLLLLDDDAPLVLLTAVHDVLHPLLDLEGVLATDAFAAHAHVDVLATVVDQGDGADEELGYD